MQFGRYYEEFEVGAVYKHWPGKTVTEYDDHLFCLLTMNHHPLHLDANFAEKTTDFGKNVVVGNYIYSLLLGMSVPDVSGKAIANLEVESLRHVAPTFHGDTIYGETTVLDKTRRSRSPIEVSSTSRRPATTRTARSCAFSGARSWCRPGSTSTRAAASSPVVRARYRGPEGQTRRAVRSQASSWGRQLR